MSVIQIQQVIRQSVSRRMSERKMRFGGLDASFHVPQAEWYGRNRNLIRTSFQPFKANAKSNEEPLPFGQSYWDYLPDLAQNKITKRAHKSLLEEVHIELHRNCHCPNWNQV